MMHLRDKIIRELELGIIGPSEKHKDEDLLNEKLSTDPNYKYLSAILEPTTSLFILFAMIGSATKKSMCESLSDV